MYELSNGTESVYGEIFNVVHVIDFWLHFGTLLDLCDVEQA